MFGKKNKQSKDTEKNKIVSTEQAKAKVQVMPDAFYGGKDPVIFESRTKQTVTSPKPLSAPLPAKKSVPSKTVPAHTVQGAPPSSRPPAKKPPTPKKWIILVILIFLGTLIGGIVWWFTRKESTTLPPATIPITKPETTLPTTTVPIVATPTTTPTSTEIVPTIPEIGGITFPQIISIDSVDVDEDSLTDEEERVFGTDPTVWDSDKDGFYDGQEIYNLYNPRGQAPVRLIDSGLIKDFTNPQWRYRIFYPQNWELGRVDTEGRQVLFSSITGEFIEVRVFEKSANTSFQTWFGQTIRGQQFSDIELLTNRFDSIVYTRRDSLVAYFPTDTEVIVIVYTVPESITEIRYRNIMRMMIQSFRPAGVARAESDSLMLSPPSEIIEAAQTPSTSVEQETSSSSTETDTIDASPQDQPTQTAPGSGIPGLDFNS